LARGYVRSAARSHQTGIEPNYENQAFAYGRNALALQFHLEADPRQLEEWYVGHAVELAAAQVSIAALRAGARRHADGLSLRASDVFGNWLRELDRIDFLGQPNVKA
jgi:GMP synthase (glutamine-hydrolysing)